MLLQYAQYKGVVNLDVCEEGDAIMAFKGFLIKTIANLSIHAEREMKRIKNFRILTWVVPITIASQASKISTVKK